MAWDYDERDTDHEIGMDLLRDEIKDLRDENAELRRENEELKKRLRELQSRAYGKDIRF